MTEAAAPAEASMKSLVAQLLSAPADSGDDGDAAFEQLVPVLKNLLRTGRQAAFAAELATFADARQAEIERLCSENYHDFVQAVDALLKVRAAAAELRTRIVSLNDERQASGRKLLEKKRHLLSQRQRLQNIDDTIAGLQKCLEVLRTSNKMQIQFEGKKYYSALKLMEQLETTQLPPVIHHDWAKHLHESLPTTRTRVLDDVNAQFNNWLFQLRDLHRRVGKLAMDATVLRQRSKFENLKRGPSVSTEIARAAQHMGAVNPARTPQQMNQLIKKSLSVELALNEENEFNVVDNERLRVDFVPLYQSLHIHTTLGHRDDFKKTYDENRKAQLNLVLTSSFNLTHRNQIGTFATYLQDIIGFFVIESVVCETTEGFRTRAAVEILWDLAVERILRIVGDSLLNCYDPELFLEIKVLVVAFIHTMETYEYPVTRLYELLLSLFNRYSDLLRLNAGEKVQKILDDDDYTPMTVNTPDEFSIVQKAYPVQETREEAMRGFPRTLPFSRGFPQACMAIKRFISGFYKFTEGFSQQYGEMDDIFRKALEALLSRNVNGALLQRLKGQNLTQVVQIINNLTYFELACAEFERVVQEYRSTYRSGKVTIQAVHTFRETHKLAEKRIFQIVNDKLDNFMELVDYDPLAPVAITKPSPWLQDMIGWLSMTVASTLHALPTGIRSFVYLDIFDHLAGNFKRILLNPNDQHITLWFVESLDVDYTYVESFVATLGDPSVAESLAEMRQLINLAKSLTPDDYATTQGRARMYSRVKVPDAIALLDKILAPDEGGMFKKKDALQEQRRRNLGEVIDRLRRENGEVPVKQDRMSMLFTRKP